MHMLCLITYKVRSENGYGFLGPGLKTGVGNGIFGLKLGRDLEMQAAHPRQKFQEVPPGAHSCESATMLHARHAKQHRVLNYERSNLYIPPSIKPEDISDSPPMYKKTGPSCLLQYLAFTQ